MIRSSVLKAGIALTAAASVISGGAILGAQDATTDAQMSSTWEARQVLAAENMAASNENARANQAEREAEAKKKAKAEAKKKAKAEAAAKKAAAAKARAKAASESGRSSSSSLRGGTPAQNRALGIQMCKDRGWSTSQCNDLVKLWNKESGWDHKAYNGSSGATGIPQSLPGSKMASAGSDWRTNPATQIKWGLDYIAGRYGNPSSAWAHSQAKGWY